MAITISKVTTTASPTTTSNTPAAAARSGTFTTTELLASGRYGMTAKCCGTSTAASTRRSRREPRDDRVAQHRGDRRRRCWPARRDRECRNESTPERGDHLQGLPDAQP